MNVLIVPENFHHDQHILKPIIERMFAEIGKRHAKIKTCLDPWLGDVVQATDWERIHDILDQYPMVDIFLLIVDRDGKPGRRTVLDGLETNAGAVLTGYRILLAENAWQEIEVWALAGQQGLPKEWKWAEVRAEEHPKEAYFFPWAEARGLLEKPGQGRITMGREAGSNYKRVRSRCPEDVASLEQRIKEWLESIS